MISPAAVKTLFKTIATMHPGIGHVDNVHERFYGYNQDEAIGNERQILEYPRLGLSLKTHTGLFGTYAAAGGALQDNLNIEIELLDKVAEGDFDTEYDVYDSLKQVADDIITWLLNTAQTDEGCNFPAVKQLDLSTVQYARIGPVHTNAYGWKLLIRVRDDISYSSTNPLNAMYP